MLRVLFVDIRVPCFKAHSGFRVLGVLCSGVKGHVGCLGFRV